MSGRIRLHPTKGVNPFITVCQRCGEDIGIALPGADDGIWKCVQGHRSIGRPRDGRCPVRDCYREVTLERRLQDGEKIPMGICDKCEAELEAFDKEVKAGGLYFRCIKCKTEGVIKHDSEYAIDIRQKLKKPAPEVFGIEVNSCAQCTPEAPPTQE